MLTPSPQRMSFRVIASVPRAMFLRDMKLVIVVSNVANEGLETPVVLPAAGGGSCTQEEAYLGLEFGPYSLMDTGRNPLLLRLEAAAWKAEADNSEFQV